MTGRTLRRLLSGYAIVLFIVCLVVRMTFSLSPPSRSTVVETRWKDGKRVGRAVLSTRSAQGTSAQQAQEVITGEAPILMHPLVFGLGLVPGRDGVKAELGDKVAYATVDDLVSVQAYDKAHVYADASFGWGTHRATVIHVLSEQLGVHPSELEERATFKRVRFERPKKADNNNNTTRPEHITEKDLTRELVLESLTEAAKHLARSVDDTGRFRYLIDAPTNVTLPGYNWPRHSGSTFFLAQAASILDDPFIRYACLRAASRLRDETIRDCGSHRCVADETEMAEIGSSALALVAFTEIVRTGADGSYRPAIVDLAAFLRSQQRSDGEFMHQFNRATKSPVDVQFLYFSGEATLALARAHAITSDPRDLDAARRGLGRLSGSGWSFFGSRYYYSEEHWTCQAVAELWERAPDRDALEFCSRWHEYQRRLQLEEGDTPFDADGAFGFGPLVSPRVTPASSRGEAAGALLHVLVREKHAQHLERESERPLVDRELRRSLAFVLRNQFVPGADHLFADPVAVRGGVPGSPVDWQLRIDYAQHAGSMMARWLEVDRLTDDALRQGKN